MFKKLSTEELNALEKLLDRAVYHGQIGIGALVGNLTDGDGGTDVAGGLNSFVTYEGVGGVCNTGEEIDLTIPYDSLKWIWARVQGARGGAKRKLTSEQARAMAAKRHGGD